MDERYTPYDGGCLQDMVPSDVHGRTRCLQLPPHTHSLLYLIITVVMAWLFPGPIWNLLKYSAVGAVGHLILGLGSLRWFEQYRNEILPLIKLLGYEFTVRNADDCTKQAN
ncbi:uncharacterized protein CC84DRAFT_1166613 [Paraphaeosphaeria sporulosa]|uniref:Uncharacterized protein n=1 Tax=Paraphaeosphaeria sporulosa TaxID=1460663 RepID=A0A177C4Y0_9PLEO|nr:uncharacterized protein CC84DRAFT_1166613 [Paraphaeosphaeria sporulosa]OAG02804.1 hypothetical protein CC84DRAFT_1166613 [Paraphaeosphaeria sporulosa]